MTNFHTGLEGILIREFDEDDNIPLNPEAKAVFVDEQTSRIYGDSDETNKNILITQLATTELIVGKKLAIYVKLD